MPTSGTGGNGWTRTIVGAMSASGANSFAAGPSYALDSDPATLALTTITISVPVTLRAGRTYTFNWTYSKYGGNPRQLYADFVVNGTVVDTSKRMDSDVGANYTAISRTQTYSPATTGSYAVGYQFTFPIGTSTTGDDMTINSPVVTCS